jgi:hypothetical protein
LEINKQEQINAQCCIQTVTRIVESPLSLQIHEQVFELTQPVVNYILQEG